MKFSLSIVLAAFALQSTALLVPMDALSSNLGSGLAPGAAEILPLEVRAGKSTSRANGKGKQKHKHAHGVRPDFRKQCKSLPSNCPPFLNKKAMCECRAAATVASYLESERGCPKPSQKAC
ncbi:hypothetical protein GE21DRAFT_9470 [Neurospora crassa]|uniref:Uncharacterized protein n=1 Tax=Neurospora crassa (strain ATCC 24698 / 74-OR23-1A / CBS 708.71 / DSM 1257 / FGSC 987) TaxID=367110 RepID=Q7RXN7_NEUCR|nr:hypothetical protein NCU05134 [Neurospora crassa OR74A]EAA27396.3 hypothetical protein NCU05134 [Neurospora crassa OR74A]KHE88004.1 hypothetical protein GE21DRAFT_9470 [Neurospora crassa]|eukprot:XP_956632.3 hypothetical protein NCU05134 [Neurospora crassa OR74A]